MQKNNKTSRGRDRLLVAILSAAVLITAVIGVFASVREKATETAQAMQDYYDAKCESFGVQNANLAKGQVVFIGDSITDLYVLDEHYADLPLAAYNRGIGGDTTTGVLHRLQVSLFDIEPAYVVLMIGTNDVNFGVAEETILSNYAAIIDRIYAALPDVQLFCMSIIPQNRQLEAAGLNVDATTEIICRLNPRIRQLAAEKGATYLDLFSRLADEERLLIGAYTDDGIHLNREGLLVWTKLLKPHLAAAIFP